MLPVDPDQAGTSPEAAAYRLIGAGRTNRVLADNELQDIIVVTAQSKGYLVTFTWFVEPLNWVASGAPGIVGTKTAVVNQVCSHEHVIGFRTIQDTDASRVLNNYAVITVGTEDGRIQDETLPPEFRIRMDQLDTPAPYAAIDKLWGTLTSVGAS